MQKRHSLRFHRRRDGAVGGWLTLAAIGVIVAAAPPAHAMTVGDVTVSSALSRPLEARVLIARKPGDPRLLGIRLAPSSAYAEARMALPSVPLSALSLEWSATPQGAELKLRSSQMITEPMLTVLLDLRTARGVQRFALDVLLDAISGEETNRDRYGPVRAGETLSGIAEALAQKREARLSTMLAALKRLNPLAFGGNVHTLLEGAVLQIPTDADLRVQERLHQTVRWYSQAGRPPARTARARPPATDSSTWWWRSVDGKPAVLYVSDLMFPLEVGFWSYQALADIHFAGLRSSETLEPWLFQLDWTIESLPVPVDPEIALDALYADSVSRSGPAEVTEQANAPDFSAPLPFRDALGQDAAPAHGRSREGAPRSTTHGNWPVRILMSTAAFVVGLVLVATLMAGVHSRMPQRTAR